MNYLRNILFFLYVICLGACSNRQVDAVLNQAGQIVHQQPENALSMLRSIDANQLTSDQQQARYALLYSLAEYKNYIDTESDSLIQIAYEYYITDHHGNDKDRMISAMLLGSIQKSQGLSDNAMISFQKALKFGQKTDDYFMTGQICAALASLCITIYDSDAYKYAQMAAEYYSKAQKLDYLIDAKQQITLALYNQQQYEECIEMADSVLNEALQIKDTAIIIKSLRNIIYASTALLDIQRAKKAHQQLSSLRRGLSSKDLVSKATIFAYQGNLDSALILLKQAEPLTNDIFEQINYHNRTSLLYQKLGDYKEAYLHHCKQHDIQDSLLNLRLAKSVTKAQRDYYQQELEVEKYRERQLLTLWCGLTLILIIIIVSIIIIHKRQSQIHKLEMEKALILTSEIEKTIQAKQGVIDSLTQQVSTMKRDSSHSDQLVAELFDEKFTILNGLFTSYFNGQSKLFEKNSIYKEVQKIVKSFSEDQASFDEIEALVNKGNNNVLDSLKKDFPKMKESDYKFFCLTFAGLSTRAISLLLNESLDNIYQKRSRWKARIEALNTPDSKKYLTWWNKVP